MGSLDIYSDTEPTITHEMSIHEVSRELGELREELKQAALTSTNNEQIAELIKELIQENAAVKALQDQISKVQNGIKNDNEASIRLLHRPTPR